MTMHAVHVAALHAEIALCLLSTNRRLCTDTGQTVFPNQPCISCVALAVQNAELAVFEYPVAWSLSFASWSGLRKRQMYKDAGEALSE